MDELLVAVQQDRFRFAAGLAEQDAMSKALTSYRRVVRDDGLIGTRARGRAAAGDHPTEARDRAAGGVGLMTALSTIGLALAAVVVVVVLADRLARHRGHG